MRIRIEALRTGMDSPLRYPARAQSVFIPQNLAVNEKKSLFGQLFA